MTLVMWGKDRKLMTVLVGEYRLGGFLFLKVLLNQFVIILKSQIATSR